MKVNDYIFNLWDIVHLDRYVFMNGKCHMILLLGCLHGGPYWMWSTENINDIDTAGILLAGLSNRSDACIQKRTGSLRYAYKYCELEVVLLLITCIGLWIGVVIGLITQVKYVYKEL